MSRRLQPSVLKYIVGGRGGQGTCLEDRERLLTVTSVLRLKGQIAVGLEKGPRVLQVGTVHADGPEAKASW